jgi:hypothetical protein
LEEGGGKKRKGKELNSSPAQHHLIQLFSARRPALLSCFMPFYDMQQGEWHATKTLSTSKLHNLTVHI